LSIETEVKILIDSPEVFRQSIRPLDPVLIAPRHFEDNYALDYQDGGLRSQNCLLRVRITDSDALLTYKGPPQVHDLFKIREELEVPVASGPVLLRILERLGLCVWFRYQKYREEYAIAAGDDEANRVHVALDETPIGNYVEFEGVEAGIRALARALGFNEGQFIRESYYALYLQFCRERALEPGHMVFSSDAGQRSSG